MTEVVVIVQARVGSTRLPGKVLQEIDGKPMLFRVIERARTIPGATRAIVATTTEPRDAEILAMASALGVDAFAGSESDVLDRYYQAARRFGADVIVRVTADCPMLDPEVSGRVINRFLHGQFDYVTNCQPPTFPDGLDTEAVSFAALERAWRAAVLPSEREHVTPYIWKRPEKFRMATLVNDTDLSAYRWTVDDERDMAFVRMVYDRLVPVRGELFGMEDVLELLKREPELDTINSGTMRNEGYAKSLSVESSDGR